MGGFYLSEPSPPRDKGIIPYWKVMETRFHFPAEHIVNDVTYDAEF